MVTLAAHTAVPVRLAHRADRTVPKAGTPVAQSADAFGVTGLPVQDRQELAQQLAELLTLAVVEMVQGLSWCVAPGCEEAVCRPRTQIGELEADPCSPVGLFASTELGRQVGLSQSAAARMVESLEKQGLVVTPAATTSLRARDAAPRRFAVRNSSCMTRA
ncbi:winged helix-turn-helix domain-containing protein [Streptomyces sp. B21-083]|uniref:winged helix-turn-helix domain-containing protein n=1 Tax=Streptomyces sp. B21-083 TaxID=3039410 RepID=UPI002FF350B3